ncbi:NAD-dependent epimerase/dehydratase family protein [Sphingomonas astaxanthinifaciens]|uniref:Epimerase n=1 Tax=Sphingomonas astaxanthinifaciens DSM 22298 TaxID=1123267 RepID=A0ABQ5Z6V4_9SPHN|nr:NAD-dependent epimerase/dehydratase family protein [Sphingomonas astaxanthinifaciens]GLR48505.1 epimerase [Sphingomonas astaxanthinifaciens DSM 22298]
MRIAITGATGFVGGRLLALAVEEGHEVVALTRRSQGERHGVTWVQGALDNRQALQRLVEHAEAVIHVAGVINAPDKAGFEAGNVTGTLAVLAAATAAGVRRFVHVSSLAAREPKLSDYGASKARAEELVSRSGLDWAIVRPPAVYGPGDRETLELFKAARLGLVPLPPGGRLSLIHADDLSRLLLALADPAAPSQLLVEPDDGREGGWTHREFAAALAAAQDRRAIALPVPAAMIRMGARIDGLLRRDKAKLTPDRAAYFCHPDWTVDPARRPPESLWSPRIPTPQGLADTADWYCRHDWL